MEAGITDFGSAIISGASGVIPARLNSAMENQFPVSVQPPFFLPL
jgi:hypothetical protein